METARKPSARDRVPGTRRHAARRPEARATAGVPMLRTARDDALRAAEVVENDVRANDVGTRTMASACRKADTKARCDAR